MSEAILGTFSEVKFVKTRSVMQIVIEVPVEQADHALKMLGGIPQPSEERWVGIALAPKERKGYLDDPEYKAAQVAKNKEFRGMVDAIAKEHRPFASLPLSQQAGIRCNDRQFIDFICEHITGADPSSCNVDGIVRYHCGIPSRSELDTNDIAAAKWRKLEDDFQAYLTDLRYGSGIK